MLANCMSLPHARVSLLIDQFPAHSAHPAYPPLATQEKLTHHPIQSKELFLKLRSV